MGVNLIDSIDITASRLTVRAERSFTRRYLWDDFFVEYGEDIGLDRMPRSVALAPFLLNMAPFAWLSGEDWHIDELDSDLAGAFDALRQLMQSFYPSHGWQGRLVAERLVDNGGRIDTSVEEPVPLLYTGGVDSHYTSFRHHPKRQLLVTLWGNETPLDAEANWRLIRQRAAAFAQAHGHRNLFITSNGKDIVRRKRLRPDISVWWLYVQVGMALTGLCLPAMYHWRRPFVCISATEYRGGYVGPLGTSPELDESIRCAGIGVRHVGYDASRPEKLAYIADLVAHEGLPTPPLLVCSRPSAQGSNCEACEKCLRTMSAVLATGGRLGDFGFHRGEDEVIAAVRRLLQARQLRMDGDLIYEWTAIQRAAEAALQGGRLDGGPAETRDYARWLCNFDMHDYVARQRQRGGLSKAAKWLLSSNPWLFELVRKTVERRGWFGY